MTRSVRIPQTASRKPPRNQVGTSSGSSIQVFVSDDDLNQQLLMIMAAEECNIAIEFTFVDSGSELMMLLHQRLEFGGLPDLIIIDLETDGRKTLGQIQTHDVLWQIPLLAIAPVLPDGSPRHALNAHWCEPRPVNFDDLVALVDSLPARAAQHGLTISLDQFDLTERPVIDLDASIVPNNLASLSFDESIDLSELDF